MNQEQLWRNFSLNRELHVAGGFIYDGMRELHGLKSFENADEVFQIVYPLAVGFERLLKIAIVLLEYKEGTDQEQLEKSLITHNHLDLLRRIKSVKLINFAPQHNEFLQILGKFYKSYRYDRFSVKSVFSRSSETKELLSLLRKHIRTLEENDKVFGEQPSCPDEVRVFLACVCQKISATLYDIIGDAARAVHLYTYEVRYSSKAYKVFFAEELDFFKEDLLWKEILIYLMNTPEENVALKFLRDIQPLDFDAGMIAEYLQCLGSDTKKIEYIDELKELYRFIDDAPERLDKMSVIGDDMYSFDDGVLVEGEEE